MKVARSEDGSEGQEHPGLPERGKQKDPPEPVGAEVKLGTYLRQAEKWASSEQHRAADVCVVSAGKKS